MTERAAPRQEIAARCLLSSSQWRGPRFLFPNFWVPCTPPPAESCALFLSSELGYRSRPPHTHTPALQELCSVLLSVPEITVFAIQLPSRLHPTSFHFQDLAPIPPIPCPRSSPLLSASLSGDAYQTRSKSTIGCWASVAQWLIANL